MAGSGSTGDPDDEAFRHPGPDPQQGQPASSSGSPRRRRRSPPRRATRCSAPCSRTGCSKSARRRASTPARLARGRGRRTDRAAHHRRRPARHRGGAGRGRRAGHGHGGRHAAHGGAGRAPRTGGRARHGSRPGRPAAPDEAARAEDLARQDPPLAAPAPPRGMNLRQAAQAVLDTWDEDADRAALAGPMERLRAALAKPARAARDPDAPRTPREGTKREKVLAMLRRPEGATVAQIAESTGWARAHRPRVLRRAQEEGRPGRRAGAGAPGRAGQAGEWSVSLLSCGGGNRLPIGRPNGRPD